MVSGSDKYQQQVWLASDMGASLWNRFDNPANTWRYFFGPRYHPGTVVVDIASSGDFTVLATDGGLAVIEVGACAWVCYCCGECRVLTGVVQSRPHRTNNGRCSRRLPTWRLCWHATTAWLDHPAWWAALSHRVAWPASAI